jgi:hypothetical protein
VTSWTSDELDRIGAAGELQLAVRRRDGTLPTRGDDLGRPPRRSPLRPLLARAHGHWFRAAQARRERHISTGGVRKDVVFVDAEDDLGDAIDAAYRTKYRRYADSYVAPMIRPEARATTLKHVPRAAGRGSR